MVKLSTSKINFRVDSWRAIKKTSITLQLERIRKSAGHTPCKRILFISSSFKCKIRRVIKRSFYKSQVLLGKIKKSADATIDLLKYTTDKLSKIVYNLDADYSVKKSGTLLNHRAISKGCIDTDQHVISVMTTPNEITTSLYVTPIILDHDQQQHETAGLKMLNIPVNEKLQDGYIPNIVNRNIFFNLKPGTTNILNQKQTKKILDISEYVNGKYDKTHDNIIVSQGDGVKGNGVDYFVNKSNVTYKNTEIIAVNLIDKQPVQVSELVTYNYKVAMDPFLVEQLKLQPGQVERIEKEYFLYKKD